MADTKKEAEAKAPDRITPVADIELGKSKIDSDGKFAVDAGKTTQRVEGTIQREPTPEELPADAKVAPLAEQVNPRAAQAVGSLAQPEEIAGIPQPKEGGKNLVSDARDATQFLPEDSEQHDDAKLAIEDAERDHNRGRV